MRDRRGLHLLLLLATLYTTTIAGALADPRAGTLELARGEFLLDPGFLRLGLPYSLCLLAILGAHEMGHYLACRRYGVDASLPFFLPNPIPFLGTFGAFIRIRAPIPDRNSLFDIGVAGPLAGFVVAVPIMVVGVMTAEVVPLEGQTRVDLPLVLIGIRSALHLTPAEEHGMIMSGPIFAGWVGCLATALNLFPVGQLDGGHVSYALSRDLHRVVSLVVISAFTILGLLVFPGWIFFAMLIIFIGSRHPPVIDESVRLSPGRRVVALLSLVILIICFIPRPLHF